MAADYVNIDIGLLPDGTKRKLRYRHNEMADLEERTGKTFIELLQGQQFHGCRVMLYYGLRWREPKMTISMAGDLIQDNWIAKDKTLDQLLDVFAEALEAGGLLKRKVAQVEAEPDDPNAPTPEAA